VRRTLEGKSNQWALPEWQSGAAEMEPDDSAPPFDASNNHFCATLPAFWQL
jgi:hypothetical protein